MNESKMKEGVLTGMVILIITLLVVGFISLYGKNVEIMKPATCTSQDVVETVNSSIDGAVDAAKCPTCIFSDIPD